MAGGYLMTDRCCCRSTSMLSWTRVIYTNKILFILQRRQMKRDRRIATAWLAVFLLMLQGQARAWGPGGHMIVAFIAHERLNPKSKAEADRLIALKIAPTAITSKSLNFVNASNWPDDLRPVASFA